MLKYPKIFLFQVSTAYAKSIKFETFFISISFENVNKENSDQLIHTGPLEVQEGGSATITAQSLDAGMLRRKLRETGLRNPEVSTGRG